MISVDQALAQLFDLVTPVAGENIGLAQAAGRVLTQPAVATRDQPPFAAATMDGYAVRQQDATAGNILEIIGESAAGQRYTGNITRDQAVRIFTGAPMPRGADHVVIQEDVTREDDTITLKTGVDSSDNIRLAGADFRAGDCLAPPRLLDAGDLALLASMNIPTVSVARRPVVALIATGDELVMPGEIPGDDQIIASNSFGLAVLAQLAGADVRVLPIARDNETSLTTAFSLAAGADLIVTIGGASVGDYDIVGKVAENLGLQLAFYKIAMRPGKPLMAGKIEDSILLGLPGNPVSSMVCGHIFIQPLLRAMQGLSAQQVPRNTAALAQDLPENGDREHYMRAIVADNTITPFARQDSGLLSVFSDANALLVRPVRDSARKVGDIVEFVAI
ncbi:MAG: molybdopterin molybdotransferase MoeA [Paracoccaceae bacterium]